MKWLWLYLCNRNCLMKLKALTIVLLVLVAITPADAKRKRKHHRQVKVVQVVRTPCVVAAAPSTPAEKRVAEDRSEVSGRTVPTNRNPCQ